MQDRPTAGELLRAARDFCENELIPQLSGRLRFHARVLQNVLGILEREWADEEDAVRAEWHRLSGLLGERDDAPPAFGSLRQGVRDRNAELARRIRAGDLDDRWDEAVAAVYETTLSKLAIANPRHAGRDAYPASSET